MPQHLFIDELEALENNPPQGHYHLLVVGTFNANIPGNAASWFYGRPENEFWCLLPRMMGRPTLHPVDRDEPILELTNIWKAYCAEKRIMFVDIFKEVVPVLAGHSDKYLQKLQPEEYHLFDFKTAFANTQFDAIFFTWKGQVKGTLTNIKKQYTQFFSNTPALHMLTPSMAYAKSRHFKLEQWKQQYQLIQP